MKKRTSDEEFMRLLHRLSPDAKFKEAHQDEFAPRRIVVVSDEGLANKILEARKKGECFKTLEEVGDKQYYHCPVCGYVPGKMKATYLNRPREGIKYFCRICDSHMGTDFS